MGEGQSLQGSPLLGTRILLPNVPRSAESPSSNPPGSPSFPPKGKLPCHLSPGFWSPSPAKSLASSWLQPHNSLRPCKYCHFLDSSSSLWSQHKLSLLPDQGQSAVCFPVALVLPGGHTLRACLLLHPTVGPSQEVLSYGHPRPKAGLAYLGTPACLPGWPVSSRGSKGRSKSPHC